MTSTSQPTSPAPAEGILVRKTIHVEASPQRAFDVFCLRMTDWWPMDTHTISKVQTTEVVIEPAAGGRWFNRNIDGSECDIGRVVVWDPPRRVVLAWEVTATWQHDPALQTEVEVRFTKDDRGTLVELEHRLLERYGDRALEMKGVFDSDMGWQGLLGRFAGHRAMKAGAS